MAMRELRATMLSHVAPVARVPAAPCYATPQPDFGAQQSLPRLGLALPSPSCQVTGSDWNA